MTSSSHQAWLSHYNVNPHLATPVSILVSGLFFSVLCGVGSALLSSTTWGWRTIASMLLVDRLFYHVLGRLVLVLGQSQSLGWLTAALDFMYVAKRSPKWFITGPHMLPALLMRERTLDSDIVLPTLVVIVLCTLSLVHQRGSNISAHFATDNL